MTFIMSVKKRETELDILRIIAMLAVITVHCTGMGTDSIPVENGGTQFLIFIDSIITWQVPVFVMISGRFFLDPEREMPAKKIAKSVLRLVIAFAVWDIVYQTYYILSGTYSDLSWKGILTQAIVGPYHFWYLYMLAFVYLITPFLRKIAQSKKLMEYFILLFLVFEFLTCYGVNLPMIGDTVSTVLVKTNFHFALGYSGYYILGYYLHKYQLSKNKELILYALAAVLLVGAGVATVHRSLAEGANNEWYTKYLMPNIVIEAAAVYTLFVKRVRKLKLPEKQLS